MQHRRDEVEPLRPGGLRERAGLEVQRRRRDLHGARIDVDAVEVVLDDGLGDLAVAEDLSAMPCLFAVERRKLTERDDQEVPAPAGRIEQFESAHGLRRIRHRLLGQRLRNIILPLLFKLPRDGHEGIEGDLTDLALRPPLGPPRIERGQHRLRVGGPGVLAAHTQPGKPEAVLEQPLDHVPLGEHLRLRRDLVGLNLPSPIDLRVEGFAVGVVPVLVDPAEGGVVGPGGREGGIVEALHSIAQCGRRNREKSCQSDVPEEPREVECKLLEEELKQCGVAFGGIAGSAGAERGGEVSKLAIALAAPSPGEHRGFGEPECLEVPQQHQSIEQRRSGFLLGLREEAIPGGLEFRFVSGPGGADAFIEPGLDALASSPEGLVEPRLREGDGEPVASIGLVVNGLQEARAKALLGALRSAANGLAEELLGFGGQGHGQHRAGRRPGRREGSGAFGGGGGGRGSHRRRRSAEGYAQRRNFRAVIHAVTVGRAASARRLHR